MGHWGVKSYENDDAADALDQAFQEVHGDRYDELMEDGNPLSFDAIQKLLASADTLKAAIAALAEMGTGDDDLEKLAMAGVVVRHAEFDVPIPPEWANQAIRNLENEAIEWDESTIRKLRRQKEIQLLRGLDGERTR